MKKKNRKQKNAEHLKIVNARKKLEKNKTNNTTEIRKAKSSIFSLVYFFSIMLVFFHYLDSRDFKPFLFLSVLFSILLIFTYNFIDSFKENYSKNSNYSVLNFLFWWPIISCGLIMVNASFLKEEQIHQLKVEKWYVKKYVTKRSSNIRRVALVIFDGLEHNLSFAYSMKEVKDIKEVNLVTRTGILGFETIEGHYLDTSKLNKEPVYYYNTNRID